MKTALNLSVGDRDLPLEADIDNGANRTHSLVGQSIEISPLAGGDLKGKDGKSVKVTGVFLRFGVVVGYEVESKGQTLYGSTKDFYVNREFLEDIQPPTATSASLRETLSHWAQQRDYWHTETDGLEALCFDLASATPRATPECYPWGWRFLVPSPMPGERGAVDCLAPLHGNYWSLATAVYPERLSADPDPVLIEDHWARVFTWTHYVASAMIQHGYPWENAIQALQARAQATQKVLRPLVRQALAVCVEAKEQVTGEQTYIAPGQLSSAFGTIRLKAGTIGLLEPPTDRRPYSVMTVSPTAMKDPDYLRQVVIHECIHYIVGSKGGEPHNDEFDAISDIVGLRPEHRD